MRERERKREGKERGEKPHRHQHTLPAPPFILGRNEKWNRTTGRRGGNKRYVEKDWISLAYHTASSSRVTLFLCCSQSRLVSPAPPAIQVNYLHTRTHPPDPTCPSPVSSNAPASLNFQQPVHFLALSTWKVAGRYPRQVRCG